jgi:transposase InsO family protein
VTFTWIKDHQGEFPVETMCGVLNVSKSGFYAFLQRPASKRRQRQEELIYKIAEVHAASRKTYGSPRVCRELLAAGENVCENTVARLMSQHEIRSVRRKRFVPRTTDARHGHPIAANRLERKFEAEVPNVKWVGDITYVETGEGWLYVAAVLDLYSRKIVGWSMAEHMKTELVSAALEMAVTGRRPAAGLLHHTDRGVQYACGEYQTRLQACQIQCSMSRTGNCYDNAAMESFGSTLTTELVYQRRFDTRDQARQAIFEYIEVFYNRVRRHSAIGYVSPAAFEAALN